MAKNAADDPTGPRAHEDTWGTSEKAKQEYGDAKRRTAERAPAGGKDKEAPGGRY